MGNRWHISVTLSAPTRLHDISAGELRTGLPKLGKFSAVKPGRA